MAIACELCGASVAQWRNMPGHYRRTHPDVVLPLAIAQFGLKGGQRLLPGRKVRRALPQSGYGSVRSQRVPARLPGRSPQRALPQPAYGPQPPSLCIPRGLVDSSEAQGFSVLLPGTFAYAAVPSAKSIAPVGEEAACLPDRIPLLIFAVGLALFCVVFFCMWQPSNRSEPSTRSESIGSAWISSYQPEGQ